MAVGDSSHKSEPHVNGVAAPHDAPFDTSGIIVRVGLVAESLVRHEVGSSTLHRGQRYARQGAVLYLDVEMISPQRIKLIGQVEGSTRDPYRQHVFVKLVEDANIVANFEGHCTCPVGYQCKHVVALLLTWAWEQEEAEQRHNRKTPITWEKFLAPLVQGATSDDAAVTPVALQFELVSSSSRSDGKPHLHMRPVTRGRSGRWVRSQLNWSHLEYFQPPSSTIPQEQFLALQGILSLYQSRQRYYYTSRTSTIDLRTFPSRHLWTHLAEAQEVGVSLVYAGKTEEIVNLSAEDAQISLQLSAVEKDPSGDWQLRPSITAGSNTIPRESHLILGSPAHGIAWWDVDIRGNPRHLHLARLSGTNNENLEKLLTVENLSIPHQEKHRFLKDYYPVIRQQVNVRSADDLVELPTPQPPQLLCYVSHPSPKSVGVYWAWRYRLGDAEQVIPLETARMSSENRDVEAEARILKEVLSVVQELPGVVSTSTTNTPVLVPETLLQGADDVIAWHTAEQLLRDLDDVEIVNEGKSPNLREATEAPTVHMSGEQDGADWFDLAVSVTVNDEKVSFGDLFTALAEGDKHMLLPSGVYFSLDKPELHTLRSLIEEARTLVESSDDSLRLSRFQANFWEELEELGVLSPQVKAWADSVRKLRAVEKIPQQPVPPSVQAELRPYQHAGFSWLSFLYEHKLGGILADDMGLGKTLQAIALVCHARQADPDGAPFLVLAPTSVVGNWISEIRRFAPHLHAVEITETYTRRGRDLADTIEGADLVVSSYTLFRIEYDAYEALPWSGMLIDEAQFIKNYQGKGYQCAKRLPAPFKLVLTGTPMENNLMELWAMFSLAAPGLFPHPRRFAEYYANPIEKEGDTERLAQLQRRIKPLLVRRTKEQVDADLPEKLEQTIELDLNPKQRRAYQTYLQRERQKVLGLLGDVEKHRFEIFRSLTLLRQASLDISLVDEGRANVPSTKLDALAETLREVAAENHRVLVFSQFTRFLGLVRERLEAEGIDYCYLDGKTRNRAEVLRSFKEGDAPVFLISLKAGGVGLNLTEADYCIVLDPWWNPATENQAIDRAHRIGQTRKVMVYRLVAKDTIEEKIMALKEKKSALLGRVLASAGEPGVGETKLTAEDIRSLLE